MDLFPCSECIYCDIDYHFHGEKQPTFIKCEKGHHLEDCFDYENCEDFDA